MDDRLKENLSAMMDDQADELSIRRLLSCPESDQVCDQWRRWQRLRDLTRDAGADPVDVSLGVREALSGNAVKPVVEHSVQPSGLASGARAAPPRRWPVPALLTLALMLGFGVGTGWDFADSGSSLSADMAGSVAVSEPERASGQTSVPEIALQGLSEQQRQHLGRYLLEHAQHSSLAASRGSLGYARVTSMSAGEPY